MKKYFVLAALALSGWMANGQKIVPCKTDELYLEAVKLNPELIKSREEATQVGLNFTPALRKKGVVRYIPVVFHVIHQGGPENIPDSIIIDAINDVNLRLSKQAPFNFANGAEVNFQLCLASVDHYGNTNSGITVCYIPDAVPGMYVIRCHQSASELVVQ